MNKLITKKTSNTKTTWKIILKNPETIKVLKDSWKLHGPGCKKIMQENAKKLHNKVSKLK